MFLSVSYLSNAHKVKPLHMLSKTSAFVKSYDGQFKWTYFSIQDDGLLEKYNIIWNNVSADIKKEFLKTKIKSHGNEVTDFYDKKS